MARKTPDEINKLKEEYGCKDIYSWSKYNTMINHPYIYYLKYIKNIPEDRFDNIYGDAGNIVHQIMEDFYSNKIKYEETTNIYKEKMFELEIIGEKFDRNDDNKNEKIASKYNQCNIHYLDNFIPIIGKDITTEEFIVLKINDYLFQGYVDLSHKEIKNGKEKIVITDFKTSTIYKNDKLEKEKGQLLLYAIAKKQEGYDIEDIIIRWCFTKYVNIRVPYKGDFRYRQIERHEIGSCLKASVTSQLKKLKRYSIEEIDEMIEYMILFNTIENMPEEIKDIFIIEDCYVEVEITENILNAFTNKLINDIIEMKKIEHKYYETEDDSLFFIEINKKNQYFYAVLSGYSPKLHKPYKKYLDEQEEKEKQKDLFYKKNKDDYDINELLDDLGL